MALRKVASAFARSGLQIQATPALANSVSFAQGSLPRLFAKVVDGLKYNDSHEWAKVDGDTATVGLSDFAQEELGDIVYVELPEVGSEVKQKEQFGVVESVKAASDVYSPVSGEVTEVNSALVDDPSTVNSAPFDDGWLMKVKVSDTSELNSLLDAKAYEAKCEEGGGDH